MTDRIKDILKSLFAQIRWKNIIVGLLGSAIVAFGTYQVHSVAHITEGGILGLNLLLDHWFGISPSITNFVLTLVCFYIGWKGLGKNFIIYSAIFTIGFSVFYRIFELMPHYWPGFADNPWPATFIGALFVGIGVGLSVSQGGAQCGDDALAMAVNHFWNIKVSFVYMFTDFTVLALSLTYIPLSKILCSIVTVIISGQLIELVIWLDSKLESSEQSGSGTA